MQLIGMLDSPYVRRVAERSTKASTGEGDELVAAGRKALTSALHTPM